MNTSILTPEQKLQVYLLAKKMYEIDVNNGKLTNNIMAGMCFYISKALSQLEHLTQLKHLYLNTEYFFKEFQNLKPSKKIDFYWWPIDNTAIRLKKFDILIKKMQQQIKLQTLNKSSL